MTYLEKIKQKLKDKITELEDKQHEAFLNYQDTGYAKYKNQRYKAEEISKFLYAEENTKRYKQESIDYQNFVTGLKQRIEDLKVEYPSKTYPDVDYVLGRIYTYIINHEP